MQRDKNPCLGCDCYDSENRAISDKDVMDWLDSDLDELIDFDYGKDGVSDEK